MTLEWKPSALSDLKKLDASVADAIIRRILKMSENPEHFLDRLVDAPFFKLRCGDWRVFIDWNRSTKHLAVLRVLHRKNAYDRL